MLWLIVGILVLAAALGVLASVIKITAIIVLSLVLTLVLLIAAVVWVVRWRMYRFRRDVEEWHRRGSGGGRGDLYRR